MRTPRSRGVLRRPRQAALVAATVGALGLAPLAPAAAEQTPAVPFSDGTDRALTVTPDEGLSPEGDSTITLGGTGFATSTPSGGTFGGAYLLFGVVSPQNPDDPGSWAPSKRGVAGQHYRYAAGAGTYQSMVNYPGNTTQPGVPTMDQNGDFEAELLIPGAQFEAQSGADIDCFVEQCGVITIGAHGQVNEGVESFTPVSFEEVDEGVAPSFTADPVSVSVVEGESASFEVEVAGDPEPELQWQRATAGSDQWADLADETGAELTVPAVEAADDGAQFRAVATNSVASATSAAATLTVTEAPAESEPTTVRVLGPDGSDFPEFFVGREGPGELRARVAPEQAAGTVEFFDGDTSLGAAEVDSGDASLVTGSWPAGGERSVTATFTPEDAEAFEPSETTSAGRYQVVDPKRVIDDIVVGDEGVREVGSATMDWSIANMYNSFGYWFDKEAISGNVTVPDLVQGDPLYNTQRMFTFSEGAGSQDTAGNTVVSFEGTARVTSGSANRWDFADPQVHIGPEGDGYVTAVFSGYFRIEGMAEYDYGPERVTIATFRDAEVTTDEDGASSLTVEPIWEGQADEGTWTTGSTASFPNEFTAMLYSGVRSFFYESGSSADQYKKPLPITLGYTVDTSVAPSFTADPVSVSVVEGESASFEVEVAGDPAPELQWQRADAGSDEWADVAGETGSELTVADTALADDGARFRVAATNSAGNATSAEATLTVTEDGDETGPPAGDPRLPGEDELTEDAVGDVEFVSYENGVLTLDVGQELADEWVGLSVFSTPRSLGWQQVSADGLVSAEVDLEPGGHRAAVTDEGDALIGWTAFEVPGGGGGGPDDGGDGAGDGDQGGSGGQGGSDGKLPSTGAGIGLAAILAAAAAIAAGLGLRRRQIG